VEQNIAYVDHTILISVADI